MTLGKKLTIWNRPLCQLAGPLNPSPLSPSEIEQFDGGDMERSEFDSWSHRYDSDVRICDEAGRFPFAGHDKVLQKVYQGVASSSKSRILDLGCGHGSLAKRLYNDGHVVVGVDYSQNMIDVARGEMPLATFYLHDLKLGLPDELFGERFDVVISTYALHHLNMDEKIALIMQVSKIASQCGMLLIGDVAFQTEKELVSCRGRNEALWDYEEEYILFDDLRERLPFRDVSFQKISFCSGIVQIKFQAERALPHPTPSN
ncbi:MAG: methyltransferase domain-containing protein [Coriobacteriales bacterium]|nr:methyltransferase domain-containing protein [Coriobacteriales bacterium]